MSPESERPNLTTATEVYADFVARRERGEAVEWEPLLASHPQLSEQLRALHDAAESLTADEGEWGETYIVDSNASGMSGSHPAADEQIVLVTHIDRYLLDDHLGQGGMGVVNKVWDKNLKRSLAMKVIRQRDKQSSTNSSTVSKDEYRFLDEAQIAAKLEHPGVAPVHEIGRDADGQLYFTMRLVAGENLDAIFRKVWKGEENWTQTRAIQVLIRVCETIAFAHSRGIIHRDLKLENVMVGQFGETYVMDWGLAKQLHAKQPEESGGAVDENPAETSGSHLETQAGTIIGTPRFMAPEQAAGKIESFDERTDVYAIGVMLYVLLARQPPYAQLQAPSSVDLIEAVLAGPPMAVSTCNPKVPAELVAICDKAMARRKEDRYRGAAELGNDLQAYLDNRVVRAYQSGALAEAKKWFARNRWFAMASLTALLAIIGGLGAFLGVQRIKNAELKNANAEIQSESIAKTQALTEKEEALSKEHAALKLSYQNLNRAQSLYLATRASAVLDENPRLSLVLALEAAEHDRSELACSALVSALDQNREQLALTTVDGGDFDSAVYSPDGTLILTTSENGLARLWEEPAGRLVRVLAGHGTRVMEATFNADGSRIVTASMDGTAIIWDTATGKPTAVLRGHASGLRKAIFNSDATKVLTASFDHSARVWDAVTGRQLLKLDGHQDYVVRAVFSHDNRTIATGSADNTVRVWDAETGELRFPPLQHDGGISSVAFSPDDRYLVSTGGGYPGSPSNDRLARIWDTQTGQLVRALEGPQQAVYMAVYSGDGNWIATASQDGTARVYDASTGDLHQELDHQAPIYYLACDEAGKHLAATTSQHDVRVWRISDGSLVATFRGHEGLIRTLEFSRDAERLLTASNDGTVREWLVSPHGVAPVIDGDGQTHVELSPGGSRIATWNYSTPTTELREFPSTDTVAEITPGGDTKSVAFSSDSTLFAVATTAHLLAIYDAADGKLLHSIDVPYDSFRFSFDADGTHVIAMGFTGEPVLRFRIDDGELMPPIPAGESSSQSLSPTGDRLFTYSRTAPDGQLWDLQTGKLVAEITGGEVLSAQFDPAGRKLLVRTNQLPPHLYDAETGELVGVVSINAQRVRNALFINDGAQVAIITNDRHLDLFDSLTAERLQEIDTTNQTGDVRVNHQFTRLLTRSTDNRLQLWDIDTGQQLAVLMENVLGFGEFSPDGNQLLTRDTLSNFVVLHRAHDGATLVRYTGPSTIASATFDPSGKWIVATCEDGDVHVWPVDPLELGRRSVRRKLTPTERERLDLGDREDWPKYRRDWSAELIRDDLAKLAPALDGGGTWQQRTLAERLLKQLSKLIADAISAGNQTPQSDSQDADIQEMIDPVLKEGRAVLASAGRDDPRLLIAVAELDVQRKDFKSAILLAEEAVRSPAVTPDQFARLQTCREALPQTISFDSIDAALSRRSSPGEHIELELAPDNPSLARYLEARLAQDSSRYDRAIPLLEELCRHSSGSALPAIHLAECFLATDDAEAAEEVLATLLVNNRHADPAAWRLWARLSLADLGRTPGQLLQSPVLMQQIISPSETTDTTSSGMHHYGADLAWIMNCWAQNEVVRINCGGWDYLGSEGSFWQHDCFFRSGYRFSQTLDRPATFIGSIDGTHDDPVYQTERWWEASGDVSSRYQIPVPPGEYQITLHFAEIAFETPAIRQFGIQVEGKTIREKYSPGNRGFATADRVEVNTRVDDGLLEIGFDPLKENPKISGIEIRRVNSLNDFQ